MSGKPSYEDLDRANRTLRGQLAHSEWHLERMYTAWRRLEVQLARGVFEVVANQFARVEDESLREIIPPRTELLRLVVEAVEPPQG